MPTPCATLLSASTSLATARAPVSAKSKSASFDDCWQNSAQNFGAEILIKPWKFLSGNFNFRKHVSTAVLVAAAVIGLPSQSIADEQRNIWLVQIPDDKISEITEGMPCDRAIRVAQSTADRMQIAFSILMVQGNRVEYELAFSSALCSQLGKCTDFLTIGDGHISRLETSNGRWTRIGTQEGCTSTETFTPNGIFMEGRTTYAENCGDRWRNVTNEFTYFVCTPDENPRSIGLNPVARGTGGTYFTCDDAAAFGLLPNESFPRFFSQLSSMIDEYNSIAGSAVLPRILSEQCYYRARFLNGGSPYPDLMDSTIVYFTSNEDFQCDVRQDCSDALRRNFAQVNRLAGFQFEVGGELGILYYCFTQNGLERRMC